MASSEDDELAGIQALLQGGDKPYIESPDVKEVEGSSACFLDRRRMCAGDCAAFAHPDGATAADRCTLLSAVQDGVGLLRQLVKLQQRAVRPASPNPAPPDPRGGRA